jgi:XRE family aerobic/anaerobic benzoate catabolism transcriptional regulator
VGLVGLRGAGKSSVGEALAGRLRCAFVELDREVEQRAGLTLAQVFEVHGEAYYRRLEREVLRDVLERRGPSVVASGGGLVTNTEAWALLRAGTRTVWLRAKPEEYLERVMKQGDQRPVERHPQALVELKALLAAREQEYRRAELVVETSGRSVGEIVKQLAAWTTSAAHAP